MSLYERLEAEMVDARRQRNEIALNTLSLLKSEVVKASKESGASGSLDDELVVKVARREVKKRQEAIDIYRKAGRAKSAMSEENEMAILRTYLPAGMTEEQVEREVRAIIAELKPEPGPKAFGMVMKEASARLAGRAEGGQIAAAARKLLGS